MVFIVTVSLLDNDIKALPANTKTSTDIAKRHYESKGGAVGGFVAGALFEAGASAALTNLVGFGIQLATNIAVSYALNSLLAPSKPSFGGSGTLESSPTYGFDKVGTSFNPVGESIPIIHGEVNQGGKRIQAFTRKENGNQYLYMLLLVGEGEIQDIKNIEIDNQPIGNYDNIEVYKRFGEPDQSSIPVFSDAILQEDSSRTITTDWVEYTTQNEVDEFIIGTIFPSGLYNQDGKTVKSNSVSFDIETKEINESSWDRITSYTSISGDVEQAWTGEIQDGNELWFDTEFANPESRVYNKIASIFSEGTDVRVTTGSGSVEEATVQNVTTAGGGLGNGDMEAVITLNRNITDGTFPANKLEYKTSATIKASTRSAYRENISLKFEDKTQKDIRIRRSSAESDSVTVGDTAQINFWQEIESNDLSYDNFALLGLKIRATDQLSGRAPNVNFDVEGRLVKDNVTPLNESGFSSNPAWCVWDTLTLPENRGGAGIDEQKLENYYQDWKDFADYSDELVSDGEGGTQKRYSLDMVIDTDMRVNDYLEQVGQTINGFFLPLGDGIKPVISEQGRSPKDLFTQGKGIVQDSMNWTFINKDTRYNSVKVEILDEENDYERTQFVIPRDESLSGDELEPQANITLPGVTRKSQAFRNSIQTLVESNSERAVANWATPLEKIHVDPGDLVWVANEEAGDGWGDTTGIIEGYTDDYVILDQEVEFDANKNYDLAIIMNDGSLEEIRVASETLGRTTSIVHVEETFTSIGSDPWPQSDYTVGEVNKNKKVMRVLSIEKTDGDNASISAVEHDETKFNKKDDFSIDPLNIEDFLADDEPLPVNNLTLTESNRINADGDVETDIQVFLSPPVLDNISHFRILHEDNLNDDTRLWATVGTTENGEFTIENVPQGVRQGVKVQTVMENGELTTISQAPQEEIVPEGSLSIPPKVQNFRAKQKGDHVQLKWQASDFDLFSHYEIRRGATWDEGEVLVDNVKQTSYKDFDVVNTDYRYMIKQVSIADPPKKSKTPASEVITVSGLTDPNYVIRQEERDNNWPGTKSGLSVKELDIVEERVDDFEDGVLGEYSNNLSEFEVQSSNSEGIWNGSFSLVSSGTGSIISTTGLDNYPEFGQTYRLFANMQDDDSQIVSYFGVQDSDNYYGLKMDNVNDNYQLIKTVSGTESVLNEVSHNFNTNEFYRQEVEWQSDNDFVVRLVDENSVVLKSFTTSDSTYTDGGIGFENIQGKNYWDFARRLVPDSALIADHNRTWTDLGTASDTWKTISGSLSNGTWATPESFPQVQYTTNAIDVGKVWDSSVNISRNVDILGEFLTWLELGDSQDTWTDLQDEGEIFWDELDRPNDGTLEYRISDDATNWSPWTEFEPFDDEFRYIQVRLTVDLVSKNDDLRITSLLTSIDVDDITITDEITVSGTRTIDFSDYEDVNGDPVEFLQAPNDVRATSLNNNKNLIDDWDNIQDDQATITVYDNNNSTATGDFRIHISGF